MAKKPWRGKRLGRLSIKKDKIAPKNIPLGKFLLFATGLNLLIIAVVFLLKSFLPPEIPLYYGLAEGQEQLASSISLIIPPIISLVIILVNTILTFAVQNNLLKSSLTVAAATTSVFSTATVLKIIFLVGSF